MAEPSFATASDYENRYGGVDDQERIQSLLDDASAYILAYPGFEHRPDDPVQQRNLTRVTCAVVHRALAGAAWSGLSNVSQGAGGYNASATVANPGEDFYLPKGDRLALGSFCRKFFRGAQVMRTSATTRPIRMPMSRAQAVMSRVLPKPSR